MDTSGQFAVRFAMFLVIGLVYAAEGLELEFLLGAFAAGIIVGQAMKRVPLEHESELEFTRSKFDAIGYGFLIPIFFLIVRGLPTLFLHRKVLPATSDRRALALLAGAELPLVIAVTVLGVEAGKMPVELATAMVGAAMISVLIYPMLGMAVQKSGAVNAPEAVAAGN